MKGIVCGAALLACAGAAPAADKPAQFWNLTSQTVTSVRLSHEGTGSFGDNLAVTDPDGVDHDERLKLPTLPEGWYDIALGFKGGRSCIVRRVKIVTGKVFSVEDKDLTVCRKK